MMCSTYRKTIIISVTVVFLLSAAFDCVTESFIRALSGVEITSDAERAPRGFIVQSVLSQFVFGKNAQAQFLGYCRDHCKRFHPGGWRNKDYRWCRYICWQCQRTKRVACEFPLANGDHYTDCCEKGDACCNGTECCPTMQCWSVGCCAEDEAACGGQCCPEERCTTGLDKCCAEGEIGCGDECCPSDRCSYSYMDEVHCCAENEVACGPEFECCPADQCINDSCEKNYNPCPRDPIGRPESTEICPAPDNLPPYFNPLPACCRKDERCCYPDCCGVDEECCIYGNKTGNCTDPGGKCCYGIGTYEGNVWACSPERECCPEKGICCPPGKCPSLGIICEN